MSQPAYLQEPTRSENRLKQIFWPSIRYPQDVDLLATQGFWMCLVLAIASAILLSIGGHPVLGLLIACFFFLGGVGVRQSSIEASACVFVVYLVDLVSATVTGAAGLPVLRLVILAILVANIRGTILASRWKQMPEMQDPDLAPMRFNETWRDKLCDQLPPKLWPWARIPFFIITALCLLLEVAGLIVLYHHQHTGAAVR